MCELNNRFVNDYNERTKSINKEIFFFFINPFSIYINTNRSEGNERNERN